MLGSHSAGHVVSSLPHLQTGEALGDLLGVSGGREMDPEIEGVILRLARHVRLRRRRTRGVRDRKHQPQRRSGSALEALTSQLLSPARR